MSSVPAAPRPGGAARRVQRRAFAIALRTFRALPIPVRQLIVRAATPSYVVGAVCLVTCGPQVLALRQPHRAGWSLPGGLLQRGETPAACVRRELLEEIGLAVEVGLPVATVVAPRSHRVDVVYRVEVPEQFAVVIDSEVQAAAWVELDGLVEVDDPTRDILTAVRRTAAPDAYRGTVVGHG